MAEVVDIEDSPVRSAKPRAPPTNAEIKEATAAYLKGRDWGAISIKELRRAIEREFGMSDGGLAARKDEVKAAAQEIISGTAQPAVPVPTVPAVQTSTKRKSAPVASTNEAPGVSSGAAPDTMRSSQQAADVHVAATNEGAPPAKKAKRSPSAYNLFMAATSSSVKTELERQAGAKVSFQEVAREASQRWANLPAAEKAPFEQQAAAAKVQAAVGVPQSDGKAVAPAGGRGSSGRATGRGRGRGGGASSKASDDRKGPAVTRGDFMRAKIPLRCHVDGISNATDETSGTQPHTMELGPRLFKSGSVGWFQSTKGKMDIAGTSVCVQVQLNVTVCGSKYWLDGEGLEAIAAPADGLGNDGVAEEMLDVDVAVTENPATEFPVPAAQTTTPPPVGTKSEVKVAAAAIVWEEKDARYMFRFKRENGEVVVFQTTVRAANDSKADAEKICQLCYERFEAGATKEEVKVYRSQLYQQLRGGAERSIPVKPLDDNSASKAVDASGSEVTKGPEDAVKPFDDKSAHEAVEASGSEVPMGPEDAVKPPDGKSANEAVDASGSEVPMGPEDAVKPPDGKSANEAVDASGTDVPMNPEDAVKPVNGKSANEVVDAPGTEASTKDAARPLDNKSTNEAVDIGDASATEVPIGPEDLVKPLDKSASDAMDASEIGVPVVPEDIKATDELTIAAGG